MSYLNNDGLPSPPASLLCFPKISASMPSIILFNSSFFLNTSLFSFSHLTRFSSASLFSVSASHIFFLRSEFSFITMFMRVSLFDELFEILSKRFSRLWTERIALSRSRDNSVSFRDSSDFSFWCSAVRRLFEAADSSTDDERCLVSLVSVLTSSAIAWASLDLSLSMVLTLPRVPSSSTSSFAHKLLSAALSELELRASSSETAKRFVKSSSCSSLVNRSLCLRAQAALLSSSAEPAICWLLAG